MWNITASPKEADRVTDLSDKLDQPKICRLCMKRDSATSVVDLQAT